ncbi:MAG: hypothetical protein MJ081_08950 [Ruminococcus sp.]|nr:hypothetical protein [Ruminococcus sp.]
MKSRRLTDNVDDKISEPCFFRVSPNQMYEIEERFRQSGMKSFSAFLRQQVLCRLQLQFDNGEYNKNGCPRNIILGQQLNYTVK